MTTRILHTADVHLAADAPERQAALETVLDRAETQDADVVTIGGDLFDTPESLDTLRPTLRNDLFTDRPFEILLIPGNHDEVAFRGDIFFGDACTVLAADPFDHWVAPAEDLRITGLPYRDTADDELLLALQERDTFEGTEVLLLHCSLDAPFDDHETGDESARRYFPITRGELTELGFEYYLAGHYHSTHEVTLSDDSAFAYPGTPASTSRSETGRRQVCVLDPAAGLDFETIPTFHYATRQLTVTPGTESAVLAAVERWAAQLDAEHAAATVTVEGFVDEDETAFAADLEAAAGPATVENETRGLQAISSQPLYTSFEAELDGRDWDEETKSAVRQRTLRVFSRLLAEGTL